MKHDSFNESTEMYLKTISELAGGKSQVPISALAERMGVSTVSATEMVHRLCDRSLLEHTPYRGVLLTSDGKRGACLVIRRHRLWERFLYDHLRLPWQRVHDVACQLEHVTEDDATEALAAFLAYPQTCPHGNPIPGPDGELQQLGDTPLSEWAPGDRGTISRIHPESILLLDYLAGRQILPDQPAAFTEIAPFNGPLMIEIGGRRMRLGAKLPPTFMVFDMMHDPVCPREICPLTMAPIGQELRLCQLCGGRRLARRLAELGLTRGVQLRVVQDAGGPLLIRVRNSRIALGRGVASQLRVELLSGE